MSRSTEKSLQLFCQLARKKGALETKVIDTRSVVTSAWVRFKCQYGCDGYGGCLTCPPYSPPPEKTEEALKQFKKGILLHGDEHTEISKVAVELEREIFLSGYYKALAFGSGPCRLCRRCDIQQPCRHPEKARPSMEAAGIDVFQTVRNNGFKIEVLKSPQCRANYFALVLIK